MAAVDSPRREYPRDGITDLVVGSARAGRYSDAAGPSFDSQSVSITSSFVPGGRCLTVPVIRIDRRRVFDVVCRTFSEQSAASEMVLLEL